MFVVARKGMDKIYVARHPSVGVRRQLPFQGSLWAAALEASPVRGYGAERRLRRRKLFLMRQTAVTPFIIACSAIESIGPPFAHRSGLYRFAVMQRSQSTSVLQHAPCDAGTANRTVDAPSGADGGVRCPAAPLPRRVDRGCIAAFVGDDACIVPRGLRLDDGFAPPAGKSRIVGRAISPAAGPCGIAGFAGRCEHRPLRSTGEGPAGLCRTFLPPGGNAPLRLRLAAHPPSGLRCPHRAACAEAHLRSATAALPRSGKDRRGERLAPAGAVSEANRAAGPALRPEIGRSYAFYRRTGDNKRSDGRLLHEKQLSPPQAALDSAAPCRGGFGAAAAWKAPL